MLSTVNNFTLNILGKDTVMRNYYTVLVILAMLYKTSGNRKYVNMQCLLRPLLLQL